MNFEPIIQAAFQKSLPVLLERQRILKEIREQFEKQFITFCVNQYAGNLVRTAKYLDIERNTLRRKCIKYSIAYGFEWRKKNGVDGRQSYKHNSNK